MRRKHCLLAASILGLITIGVIVFFVYQRHHERQLVQGTWTADGTTLTIDDQHLTLIQMQGGQAITMRLLYRLNTSTNPKQIITTDADNPNATNPSLPPDQQCPGIYEVNGDKLRLCIGTPGSAIPKTFDGSEGMVFVLKRGE